MWGDIFSLDCVLIEFNIPNLSVYHKSIKLVFKTVFWHKQK